MLDIQTTTLSKNTKRVNGQKAIENGKKLTRRQLEQYDLIDTAANKTLKSRMISKVSAAQTDIYDTAK